MSSDQNDIRNLQEKIQAAKNSSSPDAPNTPKPIGKIMKVVVEIVAAMAVGLGIGILAAVSYTHLTLPTIYSV